MANTNIQLKKSGATGNVPASLAYGELALNYADGRLYYKNASGVITYIQSGTSTNSFSTINSNSSLILATTPLDTLSFVAGNNISISTDSINKKITISSTASGGGGSSDPFIVSDDVFTGNGSNTSFTLSSTPTDVYSILVNINGVLQLTSSYSLVGSVLTFTEAPASGAIIEVKTTGTIGSNTITFSTALAQAAFDKANVASDVNSWQNTQITAVNNFAAGAYMQGNNAYSLAFAAYDTANGSNGLASGAYNAANGANSLASAAYNAANGANGLAAGAYNAANTNTTNITSVNQFAQSAYNTANGANGLAAGAYNASNTNLTNITLVNQYAASSYDLANTNAINITIQQGVNDTQNTRLNSIETINTNQNTSISIIQGVDVTQNTRLDGIEGVNVTQNNNIIAINQYAASAYAKANNGGLFTGNVTVGQDLYVTGNLIVSGNVTSVGATDLIINDPIIYVANNNPANIWDIGLAGNFNNGVYQHTGLVRDATDNQWKLFSNVVAEPTNTVDFTYAVYDNIRVGTITGNVVANTVVVNGFDLRSVQDTQNTNITSVNNYAVSAYNSANTNATTITAVNQFAQAAFDKANTSSVTLSDSVSSNSSTTAATSNAVLIAVSTALAYSIALG